MIRHLRIRDFKSYRDATLSFSALTVLVGANASGKSNALEAIRLLSWIAQGNQLGAIKYAVYEGDQAVRGIPANIPRTGRSSFMLDVEIDNPVYQNLSITLTCGDTSSGDFRISDERIFGKHEKVPLYEVVGRSSESGRDLRVAYNNFARGGHKPQVTCTDDSAIFLQLIGSARFEEGHRKAQRAIPETCRRYKSELSSILFLDPQPHLMRDYSFPTEQVLRGNGSNLSGVLKSICSTPHGYEQVLDFVMDLPEQNISYIHFLNTDRGEQMIALTETFGGSGRQFDATLLSDGTLRVLSIAAALLSAEQGSLVVIEEIDNGVHPSRANSLLEKIARIAQERQLRVLISSHNPALLDALPESAIPNVVFCFRDPVEGWSQLLRVEDIPRYPALISQGSVGHLVTRGLLDRFAKAKATSRASDVNSDLEWLAKIAKM